MFCVLWCQEVHTHLLVMWFHKLDDFSESVTIWNLFQCTWLISNTLYTGKVCNSGFSFPFSNDWLEAPFLYLSTLVLVGVESKFFIKSCMVVFFGFVLKTVLITQLCFSYCRTLLTQHEGLLFFTHYLASEQAALGQQVGRGHNWDSCPQLVKGIFHTVWLCA